MKPMIVITDAIQESGDVSLREKTVALFGAVVYRRSECYPVLKDKAVGFTSNGSGLTCIEDE